jgi:hypothetical protein
MGMFDKLECNMAMPGGREPGTLFQTKSLGCCMNRFTIIAEGRLIYHKRRLVSAPDREVRPGASVPKWQAVPVADIDINYHGDIQIYTEGRDGAPMDYVVRFTHGGVEWIKSFDTLPKSHQGWCWSSE